MSEEKENKIEYLVDAIEIQKSLRQVHDDEAKAAEVSRLTHLRLRDSCNRRIRDLTIELGDEKEKAIEKVEK